MADAVSLSTVAGWLLIDLKLAVVVELVPVVAVVVVVVASSSTDEGGNIIDEGGNVIDEGGNHRILGCCGARKVSRGGTGREARMVVMEVGLHR